MFENLWKIAIAMSKFSLSLKNSVVSSANRWILVTYISRRSSRMALFLICIPLISLALILMARSSTPSMKSRGIGTSLADATLNLKWLEYPSVVVNSAFCIC